MMKLSKVVFVVAFIQLCATFCVGEVASARSILFTRRNAPTGWSMVDRANFNSSVKFFLAIKQQNLALLESTFWSVSDPKSENYQNYLTPKEINDIIAPKPEDLLNVKEWLLSNGISENDMNIYSDCIEVETSVKIASQIFQTEFYQFIHNEWDRKIIRQYGSFSIPSVLLKSIDMIIGISNFPKFRGQRFQSHSPSQTQGIVQYGIIAQTTHELYNVKNLQQDNDNSFSSSQGVIEFDFETFSESDLSEYSNLVEIPILPITPDHIIGNNGYGYGAVEATLDIQFIATVNNAATNWFWIEDDTAWLYGFAVHFLNTTNVPSVISISYGWWEGNQCALSDECSLLGVNDDAYVARVNVEFQKIGLRGISIIVSSGDSGAHGRTDPLCTAPTLRVDFPGSSPFVTSVGATQVSNGIPLEYQPPLCTSVNITCAFTGTESPVTFAVSNFASGGGFSGVASQPSYQKHAVKKYLSSGVPLPPSSYYNASNRAHPDVSAVGNNNIIYDYGSPFPVGGTSASAPIFAALISKLNVVSLKESGKPLGFLNPLLYQAAVEEPNVFHDMFVGDNFCTEFGCSSECTGWYAIKGWDPVSGLGTPNYGALADYVKTFHSSRPKSEIDSASQSQSHTMTDS